MHETGFLARLVPELARVTFMVQHDRCHRYTVDEHTLAAVEALDDVAARAVPENAGFRAVLDRLPDAAPLYLALLLHDVGKGQRGPHGAAGARLAERACRRLHLPEAAADDVVFLVRHHLDMSHVSQRRDLSEAAVVARFARMVGTPRRLDMLLLLTYADTRGVGPGVWTQWKATLLWELYARVRLKLAGGSPLAGERDRRGRARDGLVSAMAPEFPASVVERHLALMPERYVRALTPARLKRHLRLVRWLAARPVAAAWRPAEHHTELTVCTADRPGVLAALAGALTAAGTDILGLDAYTREDGVALDTFVLTSPGGEQPIRTDRWKRVETKLLEACEGRLDVEAAVEARRREERAWRRRPDTPPVVSVDGEASESSTVVEVHVDDQCGLVYRIARTMSALGLDIALAKVTTEKSRAFDVFYVRESGGGKLAPERAAELERALGEALRPARI
jgi:[protein-PII] uridylyltransferase